MRTDLPQRREPLPVGRMALLALLGVTLVVMIAATLWSSVSMARFGRIDLGVDFRSGSWLELAAIRREGGHRLTGVWPGRLLARAGLRDGDLVAEVNGRSVVEHPAAWYGPMLWGTPGDTLTIAWIRGGDPGAAEEQARALERLSAYEGARAWAEVWEARQDTVETERALRRAAALDTTSARVAAHELAALFDRQQRFLEAAEVYTTILTRNPNDMRALYQQGKVWLWAGRNLDQAAECFRRYLVTPPAPGNPSWAQAHWRLGLVYSRQGKRAEAIAELRRALDLDPGNHELARNLHAEERNR